MDKELTKLMLLSANLTVSTSEHLWAFFPTGFAYWLGYECEVKVLLDKPS